VVATAVVGAIVSSILNPDFISAAYDWTIGGSKGSSNVSARVSDDGSRTPEAASSDASNALPGAPRELRPIEAESAVSLSIPDGWAYQTRSGSLQGSHDLAKTPAWPEGTGIWVETYPAGASSEQHRQAFGLPRAGFAASVSLADALNVHGVPTMVARDRLQAYVTRLEWGQAGCRLEATVPFSWPRHSGYLRRWTGCAGRDWLVLEVAAIPEGGAYVIDAQAMAPNRDYARSLVEVFRSIELDAQAVAALERNADGESGASPSEGSQDGASPGDTLLEDSVVE
jgi:hypothetical protein